MNPMLEINFPFEVYSFHSLSSISSSMGVQQLVSSLLRDLWATDRLSGSSGRNPPTLYTIQFKLEIVKYTLYTVYGTLYTVCCAEDTLYTVYYNNPTP